MRKLIATAWRFTAMLLLSFMIACSTPEERATPSLPASLSVKTTPIIDQSPTDTVLIKEMKFVPAVLTVTKGTSIVFINNDIMTHDVTEEATRAWSSQLLTPGKSWTMTADSSTNYFCSIHVVMKGRIEVK